MTVTPQLIKELRDETSAGFMDCKKALEQAEGDMEQARKILREKGAVVASKRADRETNQGVIVGFAAEDMKSGVMVDLRCETDFVARNEEFVALANELAKQAHAYGKEDDLQGLMEQPSLSDNNITVAKRIEIAIGKTGEKIDFTNYAISRVPDGENGVVDVYIHHNNKVGVMVALTGSADAESLRAVAHEIAIQGAWSAPKFVTRDEIDPSVIEAELQIEKQRALNEGKPENVAENIAKGRVEKGFIQQAVLLEQRYYRDDSLSIADLMKQKGSDLKIARFARLEVGA